MDNQVTSFIDEEQERTLYKGLNNCPGKLLGLHNIGKEQIIVVYRINAVSVKIRDEITKEHYEMKEYHKEGLYVLKLERKRIKRYQIITTYQDASTVAVYDPYSFKSTLGDLDIYLFFQGNHYEIYKKLGAHIETITNIKGTVFRVYAPHARSVSVVGDFNCWDGRLHPMNEIKETGIYELFIPGVNEGQIYKYQIKTKKGEILYKADPYANLSELRPKNASIVTDLQTYKWKDQKWEKQKKKKERLELRKEPLSIYEMHLGSFKRKENNEYYSYRELSYMVVPYVKSLGYTHVELIGVAEYPYDGSWGYQVTGYYAPTCRYGLPQDFMFFIEYLHNNDIGVIIDWVPAHFPKDEFGLERFDGEALYEYANRSKAEHKEWGTYRFNYADKTVNNFLIGNALFWIREYHIDGIRVDAVASMLYLDYGKNAGEWEPNENGGRENLEAAEFFRHLNSIISELEPHVIMIAEDSSLWPGVTAPVSMGGLGFLYKWNLGFMNDILEYMKLDPYYRQFHHDKLIKSFEYMYSENFILVFSHDEVVHLKGSLLSKMPGESTDQFVNLQLLYTFMFGHPGKKLLFMGQEFAQRREWSEQRSLDWGLLEFDVHKKIQVLVEDLNTMYKKYAAFFTSDFEKEAFHWVDQHNAEVSMLAFYRDDCKKKSGLLFVYNFTPVTREDYTIMIPDCKKMSLLFNSYDKRYRIDYDDNLVQTTSMDALRLYEENGKHFAKITVYGLSCKIFRYLY